MNALKLFISVYILSLDVVFLAGIENAADNVAGCRTVAALLHYFLLASFAWMLTEGILHYLKLVKVIDNHVKKFFLKACICSWGQSICFMLLKFNQ